MFDHKPNNLSYCWNKYKCSPELLCDFTITTRYTFDTVQLLNTSAVRKEREGEGTGRGLISCTCNSSGVCEFLLHRTSDKTQPEVILIPFLHFVAPVGTFNKMVFHNTSQHYIQGGSLLRYIVWARVQSQVCLSYSSQSPVYCIIMVNWEV